MNLAGTQPLLECPVEELGSEARQILAALMAADDALLQDGPEAHAKHEEEGEILVRHLQGIAERATHLRAASPAGVLFQLALINDFADLLRRDANRAADVSDQLHSAIQRMLYSIIAWIEENTGAKAGDVCDYYLPPERNPHPVIERALQDCSGFGNIEGKDERLLKG